MFIRALLRICYTVYKKKVVEKGCWVLFEKMKNVRKRWRRHSPLAKVATIE